MPEPHRLFYMVVGGEHVSLPGIIIGRSRGAEAPVMTPRLREREADLTVGTD